MIDPLMRQTAEQPAEPDNRPNGLVETKLAPRRQPSPRKRAPAVKRVDDQPIAERVVPIAAPVVSERVVDEMPTAELQVFDALAFVERPVEPKPAPRRQPSPGKRAPTVTRVEEQPVVESPARIAAPVVSERVVDEMPTAELQVFDDFAFDDRPVEAKVVEPRVVEPRVVEPRVVEPRVVEPRVVEPRVVADRVAERRVARKTVIEDRIVDDWLETPLPYVLPKIIPGEPDPVPDELPAELLVPAEPEVAPESKRARSISALKPQFLRVTKKLARSLQPVIVPRHRPRVRRVTRVVRHIDTWSVFKIALLFNIFLYAVCLTAGVMLWRVALNTGTIENIERFFESFGWQTFELKGGEIYHNAWIAGLFGIVGLTGLAVLAATMFNLITDLVGGVRVTVLEEEVVAQEPHVAGWRKMLRPPLPARDKPPID